MQCMQCCRAFVMQAQQMIYELRMLEAAWPRQVLQKVQHCSATTGSAHLQQLGHAHRGICAACSFTAGSPLQCLCKHSLQALASRLLCISTYTHTLAWDRGIATMDKAM